MQVSVFCQEPHTHAIAQQTYTANERKEPQLHKGILKFSLMKNPSNTESIAGDEAKANFSSDQRGHLTRNLRF